MRLSLLPLRGTLKIGSRVAVKPPAGAAAVRFHVRAEAVTTLAADITVHDVSDHPGAAYEAHIRRGAATPQSSPNP